MKALRFLLILLGLAVLGLSSCNTTAGFGADVQKVGKRLENRAENTQQGYGPKPTPPPAR